MIRFTKKFIEKRKKKSSSRMIIKLIHGDCLIEHINIESGSVDLILTDLPYGTINNIASTKTIKHGLKNKTKWDNNISVPDIMNISNRILRKNGKLILFSQQPFTTELINNAHSNLPFNYNMIWIKDHFANSLIAKKAPLNYYEDVLVFSKTHDFEKIHPLRPYFKQILDFIGKRKKDIIDKIGQGADHCFRVNSSQFYLPSEAIYKKLIDVFSINKMQGFKQYDEIVNVNNDMESIFNLWQGGKYKSNILKYKKDYNGFHPTQKPILLLEDLIKTFTNENDLVVDLTMGSGSSAIACINTNRNFIGIEIEKKFFDISIKRIKNC